MTLLKLLNIRSDVNKYFTLKHIPDYENLTSI